MLENSDAKAVIVEDGEQLEKIRKVRDACPKLEHMIRMTGEGGGAISAEELDRQGLGSATSRSGSSATRSITARRHLHLHLHVGHHRARPRAA